MSDKTPPPPPPSSNNNNKKQDDSSFTKVILTQTLLRVDEVFVYIVPPMKTSGGHRAEDWNLAKPLATCALNLIRRDNTLLIRLMGHRPKDDGPKGSTEEHLFAQAQIVMNVESGGSSSVVVNEKKGVEGGEETQKQQQQQQPSMEYWVEAVVDSSRYFVIRCEDENNSKRVAHVGMGFRERDDAMNFKMGLSDFTRSIERERKTLQIQAAAGTTQSSSSSSDGSNNGGDNDVNGDNKLLPAMSKLSLKEGETIRLNFNQKNPTSTSQKQNRKGGAVGSGGLLLRKPPPPASKTQQQQQSENGNGTKEKKVLSHAAPRSPSYSPLVAAQSQLNKDGPSLPSNEPQPPLTTVDAEEEEEDDDDDWGDFESGC